MRDERALPLRRTERAERAVASWGARLDGPAASAWAVVGILVLAFALRLPLAASADDVCCGHPDSWTYFHQAYAEHLSGNAFPDAHRGSGWQLLLSSTLVLLGFEGGGAWTPYGTPMSGEAAEAALVAHTLSAALAVGAVAATWLLGRDLLGPRGALLAALLVAIDPFLVRLSTSAMSEPLYVPLFVLATLTTLRARRHPAWLVGTGVLMALGHLLRVNGLVMFVALLAFAALLLSSDARGVRRKLAILPWRWIAASVAAFLLVASPYLAWREIEGHGALDYGTNQRFWADELWDLDDPWWQAEFRGERIGRETMGDYFARHTLADAALRLYQSVAWQVFDLVGSGRWPAFEDEGGAWVGSPREESALTPLLAGLALVGAFTAMRRPEWWALPVALAFTFATFVWIYPLVRSVRYFAPLVPLFALAAVAGWRHLAALVRCPHLVGAAVFGAYLLLYAGAPLLHAPEGVRLLAESAHARFVVAPLAGLWTLLALAPALVAAWRRRARDADAGARA